MIRSPKDIIIAASLNHYALGAFNVFNVETIIGVLRGIHASHAPAVVQISQSSIQYANLNGLFHFITDIATDDPDAHIALHLDHGGTFELAKQCIDAGFSSVMIDGSALPFEKNVALTKQVVDYAHPRGVIVQAELGTLAKNTGRGVKVSPAEFLADPEESAQFCEQTGIDCFAPAIGNVHGLDASDQKLDFERLAQIRDRVSLPLVLHGGSGIPDEDIRRAIELGISVVNIDTDLRTAFTDCLKQTLHALPDEIDPRKLLGPSIDAVSSVVEKKIQLFGSTNRI